MRKLRELLQQAAGKTVTFFEAKPQEDGSYGNGEVDISKAFLETFTVMPTAKGLLNDLRFAVKDVFDVLGFVTSFGNRLWKETHPQATQHAACITQLLEAGAECVGKTTLGEFSCGVEGRNFDFGMPINPVRADLVSGGSSSGSVSAVGFGLVDFSLGTDTAGSVRIPASYCGIYGMRPSQGAISLEGCLSLSPSLDTVGVFSSSVETLRMVMQTLLPHASEDVTENIDTLYVLGDLLELCVPEVRIATQQTIDDLCHLYSLTPTYITMDSFEDEEKPSDFGIGETLRYILCDETWKTLGQWIESVDLQYLKETHVDFSPMKEISPRFVDKAYEKQKAYCHKLRELLHPHGVLCMPTLATLPRKRPSNDEKVNEFDYEKLRPFVSVASVCGLPQINLPRVYKPYPIGVSLIGAHGMECFLLKIARNLVTVKMATLRLPIVLRQEAIKYVAKFVCPKTSSALGRYLELINQINAEGVKAIWENIRAAVAMRMFDEFGFLFSDEKDPNFIELIEAGQLVELNKPSFQKDISESEGYRLYFSALLDASKKFSR